jgi:hypothetical protein
LAGKAARKKAFGDCLLFMGKDLPVFLAGSVWAFVNMKTKHKWNSQFTDCIFICLSVLQVVLVSFYLFGLFGFCLLPRHKSVDTLQKFHPGALGILACSRQRKAIVVMRQIYIFN